MSYLSPLTITGLPGAIGRPPGPQTAGEDFGAALGQAVRRVNQLQHESAAEIGRLLTGETEDLHKTLLTVQRSELAFELLMEVRSKVVQAYQEIMRIQV